MLEMSISPLGDRHFAQSFEVIFLRWTERETDEGEEMVVVKGGVFTEVELPTVHSILSAVQYLFKLSWAFKREMISSSIQRGLTTKENLTAEETVFWHGDIQNR